MKTWKDRKNVRVDVTENPAPSQFPIYPFPSEGEKSERNVSHLGDIALW
jgi:hypothetical protein